VQRRGGPKRAPGGRGTASRSDISYAHDLDVRVVGGVGVVGGIPPYEVERRRRQLCALAGLERDGGCR
jgi:hypothetical protein